MEELIMDVLNWITGFVKGIFEIKEVIGKASLIDKLWLWLINMLTDSVVV